MTSLLLSKTEVNTYALAEAPRLLYHCNLLFGVPTMHMSPHHHDRSNKLQAQLHSTSPSKAKMRIHLGCFYQKEKTVRDAPYRRALCRTCSVQHAHYKASHGVTEMTASPYMEKEMPLDRKYFSNAGRRTA